jgi:hypothetical protein
MELLIYGSTFVAVNKVTRGQKTFTDPEACCRWIADEATKNKIQLLTTPYHEQ